MKYSGKAIADWRPYVGHRCLVFGRGYLSYGSPQEVQVLEVSPAGRVKFLYDASGTSAWRDKDENVLVEDLGEIKS